MQEKKLYIIAMIGALVCFTGDSLLGFFTPAPDFMNKYIGICFSYVMNKIFTFQTKQKSFLEFIKFIISMLIAWCLNFITLKICLNLGVNPYISQIVAGAIYTITGYLLSKIWVFKK